MKAAPLCWAAKAAGIHVKLIHTGQHYDPGMNHVFFEELGLPKPHHHLGVGSGTHGQVTARSLERLEEVFAREQPDWVLVVGDVNSTLAGALAAVKLGILCGHVEAGLRSFDRSMPEEINRMAIDAICDQLFASEPAGVDNLTREGHPEECVHLVGNVMIDTLDRFLPAARRSDILDALGLEPRSYGLLTLHRPSNVDAGEAVDILIDQLERVQNEISIVFPVHPRTSTRLEELGRLARLQRLKDLTLIEPQGYLAFLCLMNSARFVLTDSGGIQEETTVLGVPCLTLRDNTERPITCEQGTNILVGARGERLFDAINVTLAGDHPGSRRPDLWDGHAAERIVGMLHDLHADTEAGAP
jgi:UDP-N-acetylglucosamine 2-epimerase (non-hydrolysing)